MLYRKKVFNIDIKHQTDLVKSIGKRENKRKHKHYMNLKDTTNSINDSTNIGAEDKYLRIGLNWKKQPFKGRPKVNNMFMDIFKFTDDYSTIIIFNENWGAILAKARQHIKDNAHDFYHNDKYISVYGRTKKTGEWIELAQFNTTDNKWLI